MICSKCGNRDHDLKATNCRVCGSPVHRSPGATARSSSQWRDVKDWRRHLVQRLGAPPFEIKEGQTFTFGRKSECDMTISSPKISRKHAEVIWQDGAPVLCDLGSENGTLVNGKPIKQHPLKDNDEISIGLFSCTYRCIQGRNSTQVAQDLLDSQADTQSMAAVAMTGTLKDMGVYELLETLSYNQKTGTLEVYSPKGAEGKITLQEGYPLYACSGSLLGEQAIYHLLGWGEGNYRFVAALDDSEPPNLRATIQEILMRAKRRDEQRASGPGTGSHQRPNAVPPKPKPKHTYAPTEKHQQQGGRRRPPPPPQRRP